MSEAALEQWFLRFGNQRQIHLGRHDQEPFTAKKDLGRGGYGVVYEVTLGGLPVALKTTRTRKITDATLREVEVLRHVSKDRHRHIVALIGSYVFTESRKGCYDLGLVIWPVAHCDLQHFLAELEVLSHHDSPEVPNDDGVKLAQELESAIHTASAIVGAEGISTPSALYLRATDRLGQSFGCIASAISWLHDEAHVRHRDLKPAQILLSREGLWLTDFGVSTLISNLDDTATTGLERLTARYKAPERAKGLPRGRAEDVFALGCVYLEMGYVMAGLSVADIFIPDRYQGGAWSYEHNLATCSDTWLKVLEDNSRWFHGRAVAGLLRTMLSLDPSRRPTMKAVVQSLHECAGGTARHFGPCCVFEHGDPTLSSNMDTQGNMDPWAQFRSADTTLDSGNQASLVGPSKSREHLLEKDLNLLYPGAQSQQETGRYLTDAQSFPSPIGSTLPGATSSSSTYRHPKPDITMLDISLEGAIDITSYEPTGMFRPATPDLQEDIDMTDAKDTPGVAQCPYCGIEFTGKFRLGNMRRHVVAKHETSEPFQCEVEGCSRTYSRRDVLLRHYRRYHPTFTLMLALPPEPMRIGT